MEIWTYSVVPVPGGWPLEQASGLRHMFLSGGRAEAKAKQLAQQANARGGCAEVLIFDRDNSLVARRRYDQPFAKRRREPGEGEAERPA